MKNLFKKILPIALMLFLLTALFVFGQTQEKRVARKEEIKSDTTQVQGGKLLSKITEIRIGEEGIFVRTHEGKELKIDFEQLKNLEIPQIETTAIEGSKKAYTINHDLVKTGRDIVVEEDEEVDGDIVAVGGDITVKGSVTGDVVAVGGDILVASTGVIEGDAASIGGKIKKETGAIIRGKRFRTFLPFQKISLTVPSFFGAFHGLALVARIIKIMLFLFLGIVVISIVPKNVAKVKDRIQQDFLKSALVGLAGEILILPIFVLLIVTIIGIPVAVLVEPLLILAALILGYTGISYFIGEKLRESTNLKPESPMMTLVIGILAVESVLLLARVVGIFGHFLTPLSWILTFIGWMIWYVVITVGFGASILTRLGTRPKEVKLAEASTHTSNFTNNEKTLG
jgi:hypothetical protein